MDDASQIFEKLGRVQGDVSAILRGLDELGRRLDGHFEDDKKLAIRVTVIELEQATAIGIEATRRRRSNAWQTAMAAAVAAFVSAVGSALNHWPPFGSH